MITFYFDTNLRTLIQSPGNQAPASPQTWVYGDNYNLQVYVVQAGQFLPILASDTLTALLYQPAVNLPEQQLAIIGTPAHATDANGNAYFSLNINLATTQLAALVQSPNKAAVCQFHFVFNPTDQERFSESADVQTTVNPDPTQGATGGTPAPAGYPSNPNVFELVANKNQASGYAGLDANSHLNPNQVPTDTTLHVSSGLLGVVSGGAGGNPWVVSIPASFTIPAVDATVAVTLAAAVPDLIAGQSILVTDGTSFIQGKIQTVSGTALTIFNNGAPGNVSGTMAANSHVYLGNSSSLVNTAAAGLVSALPTGTAPTPAQRFFRGDGSYAQVNYPDLTNIPPTFTPATHGSQHVTGGNDLIPLVTPTVQGLCPPVDNSTIQIVGGKLVASTPGGGNPYVGTTAASFILPAINASVTITLTAVVTDIVNGMTLLITDGTHEAILSVTSGAGSTSLVCTNLGGGSASGVTVGAAAHVYLSAVMLASTAAPGIARPDGTTITIAGGVLTAAAVGIGQHGARITFLNGNQSIASGLTPVVLSNFTTKSWDTDTYASGAGPWSGLTVPSTQYGFYMVDVLVMWFTSSTAGTVRAVQLTIGGTVVSEITSPPQAATGLFHYMKLSALVWVSPNAPAGGAAGWPTSLTLAVQVTQDSGSAMVVGNTGQGLLGTYLSILRVS
jgi:hypothetical protein